MDIVSRLIEARKTSRNNFLWLTFITTIFTVLSFLWKFNYMDVPDLSGYVQGLFLMILTGLIILAPFFVLPPHNKILKALRDGSPKIKSVARSHFYRNIFTLIFTFEDGSRKWIKISSLDVNELRKFLEQKGVTIHKSFANYGS